MSRPWIALAVIGLSLLGGCAEWVLLHPSHGRIDAGGARQRLLPHHGGVLQIWISSSNCRRIGKAIPDLVLLEFVGNAGRAERSSDHYASYWGCRSLEIWRVNYPGFGGSSGSAALRAIPDAALAAFDAVAKRLQTTDRGSRPKVVVYGNSLGCTAAMWVAINRPVDGVMLKNPPPLQDLVLRRHGWWNLWIASLPVALQVPLSLDVKKTAPRARAPAVFVSARYDRVVPLAYQQEVVDAYAGPKRHVIQRWAHHNTRLGNDRQRLIPAIAWLLKQIEIRR